jgi:predicted nucleotidyltransferase
MDSQSIYKTIRETVLANVPNSRVLLFGSRARGEEDRFSDYDLLIITPQTFTPRENIKLSTLLSHAISKALKIPVDILINSEDEVREKQELPGHIVRTVLREGIDLAKYELTFS